MQELKIFLKSLLTTPGLSGYETSIHSLLETSWTPLTDEVHTSKLGSIHGLKKGTSSGANQNLLLAAHMDSIGLMVTGIIEGLLKLTEIGGIDPRVLPGQMVTVHGREKLPGIIIQPPNHLLPQEHQSNTVPLKYLLVDTGLAPRTVGRQVRIGDRVTIDQTPTEFSDDLLVGHPLDNRASLAALTYCLRDLQYRSTRWNIWVAATVQEEETFGGAYTSTFQIRPDLAVAVDVTFGSSPGSPAHMTYPIQKGITLGWGPNVHPKLNKVIKDLADRLEIPYQEEVMPRHSGTDAYAIQIAAEGVPTMVVSIPIRYMHTPVEMVSLKDITRAGRLLAEFAVSLDDKTIEKIRLDDDA
jgi:putative aminopeptidase FrvX